MGTQSTWETQTNLTRRMKVLGLLFLVGSAYCGVPSCNTVWEEKCWDEPRQKCDTVKVPHEVTSYDEKCTTEYENKCNTVWDTEVDYKPRKECHTVQVPRTESVPEEKCEKVPEEKCETKYEQECHTEYEQECHTEYEEECHTEHEKVCNQTAETKTDYVIKNK